MNIDIVKTKFNNQHKTLPTHITQTALRLPPFLCCSYSLFRRTGYCLAYLLNRCKCLPQFTPQLKKGNQRRNRQRNNPNTAQALLATYKK